MKKLAFVIVVAVAVVSLVGIVAIAQEALTAKVVAYYFHGTFRCVTCATIEKYAKEAIEAYFKDDIASGNIVFMAVNVEEKGNEHFVTDYQLYTKSLVVSLVKDGKEVRSKNLTQVWEYVRNKQRFSEYVVGEIEAFMGDVR